MLAAPQQQDLRASFVLPTIKCSVCGDDIAISEVADHDRTCTPSQRGAKSTGPAPPTLNSPPQKAPQTTTRQPFLFRIDPRTANTKATNKPFIGADELTPGSSASENWGYSPDTPRDGQSLRTPNIPDSAYSTDLNPFADIKGLPQHERKGSMSSSPASPKRSRMASLMAKLDSVTEGPFAASNRSSKGQRESMEPEWKRKASISSVEPLPAIAARFTYQNQEYDEEPESPMYRPGRETQGTIRFGLEDIRPYSTGSSRYTREWDRDSEYRRRDTASSFTSRYSQSCLSPTMEEDIPAVPQIPPLSIPRDKSPATESQNTAHERQSDRRRQLDDDKDSADFEPIPELPSLGYGSFTQPSNTYTRPAPSTQRPPEQPTISRSETAPPPKQPQLQGAFAPVHRSQTSNDMTIPRKPVANAIKPSHMERIGLPRTPSQNLKAHQRQKEFLAKKALPPPPPPDAQTPPTEYRGGRSSGRLGEEIAHAHMARQRSPSPGRPRSPPSSSRPPLRVGSPAKNMYVDQAGQERAFVDKPATYSMSSNASTTISHFSHRSGSSSVSSPPSSEVSVGFRTGPPRLAEQKPYSEEEWSGRNNIDELMEQLKNGGTQGHHRELSRGRKELRTEANRRLETPPPAQPLASLNSGPSPSRRQEAPQYPAPRPKQMEEVQRKPEPVRQPSPQPPAQRIPPAPHGIPREPVRRESPARAPEPIKKPSPPPAEPIRQSPPQSRTPAPRAEEQPGNIDPSNFPSPPTHSHSPVSPTHKRTATSKGPCRGCGQLIFGKSISSADGRLTGRYHKECFVCQACQEPFPTADFYVMGNLPYCELHYHRLNNSLCRGCGRGIEGPCVANEAGERFHPACFCCGECGVKLDEEYYEVRGRAFCERHAGMHMRMLQDRMRGPPGGRPGPGMRGGPGMPPGMRGPMGGVPPNVKMERRRTRMMFMGPGGPGMGPGPMEDGRGPGMRRPPPPTGLGIRPGASPRTSPRMGGGPQMQRGPMPRW